MRPSSGNGLARTGFRLADLLSWCAGEEAGEKVVEVVNAIEPDECVDEVTCRRSAQGTKDAKVLEEDDELGDKGQGAHKPILSRIETLAWSSPVLRNPALISKRAQ